MGTTITTYYTDSQLNLARLAKALGHPARIAIIQTLMKRQTCICNDIVDELNLAQPTISQHLRELKEAGIIIGTIEGKRVCYCLNPDLSGELAEFLKSMHNHITDCC